MKAIPLVALLCFSAIASANDLHMLCRSKELHKTEAVSLYTSKGRLVFQVDLLIMVDGQKDKEGGLTTITVTPAQYQIDYTKESDGFNYSTTINRVTGEMIEQNNFLGKEHFYSYTCSVVKPKM